MKYLKQLPVLVLAVVSVIGIVSVFNPGHSSAANYTDHLLDDSVMRASGTMSPEAIQSFLLSKNSGLAYFYDVENCGSTSGSHYAFYATFYSCNTRIPASKIIYDAAQAYGINPQVILATMQKEQSLISTPNPTASQLNYAMGYGCPDSGGCTTKGFFNQIDNGTWQFRVDMELSSGNSYWGYGPSSYPCNGATRYYSGALKPGNTVTFYDDNGTGYAQFKIANAATATMYCYTPHVYAGSSAQYYSGSYNFVNAFVNWFGSPYGVYSWYTTGYKILDKTRSYYVDPGQLQPGETYSVDLAATNTGTAAWANTGYSPVRLGTSSPQSRTSNLCDPATWIACNRPTTLKETAVNPGETGHFNFLIKVPYSPGNYREFFKPLAENNAWTNDSDQSLGIRVVNPGTYSWFTNGYKVLNEAGNYVDPGQLSPNTRYYIDIAVINNGQATWSNSGSTPVRFGTTNPDNHASGLCEVLWQGCSRPTSLREATVSPGETGHFNFYIKTPSQPGQYRDYFRPLAENYTWMNTTEHSLGIIVR